MAKTLFKSSDKSNFILNMTEEQYSKLASRGLFAAMLMTPLFTLAPEITDKVSYAASAGGLLVGGVIAMIIALIGLIKKFIGKWSAVPICAMGVMVLWGVVSLIKGCDITISFYGYPERGEGLLAVIFYFCFFVSAAALKKETAVRTILDGVVAVGIINSIVAVIQVFAEKLTHYRLALDDQINAASGLSTSPLFLAMVLTLSLTAALVGFVTSESKMRRTVFICAAVLFSFVMMFTYSFIGFCGLALALIIAAAAVFALKAPKKRLVCLPVSLISAAAAIAIVFSGVIGNINSYRLYDGRILWWTDSYRRASASSMYDPKEVDIDDTFDVYSYLNKKSIEVIKVNPAFGTGPEQLVLALLNFEKDIPENMTLVDFIISKDNLGAFDKVYNEYLYVAATRGVPSAIALIAALIAAVVLGYKSYRKRKTSEAFTVFALTLCGVLIFLIGCSSIPYAPVFWTIAGAACAEIITDKEKKAQKKMAKKK